MADPVTELRDVTLSRAAAAAAYARWDAEWRALIRAALDAEMTGPQVGRIAGISTARVYQIRDRRRGPRARQVEGTRDEVG